MTTKPQAFKYRIYPNKDQVVLFNKTIGSCRFVFNKGLEFSKIKYQETGKGLSSSDLTGSFLTNLKKDIRAESGLLNNEKRSWIDEPPSQSLQQSLRDLSSAFSNIKNGNGFPNFKNRHSKQSFRLAQGVCICYKTNTIRIPKCDPIKFAQNGKQRKITGKITSATIIKEPSGQYFISILADPVEIPKKPDSISVEDIVAYDLGKVNYMTSNRGHVISADGLLEKIEKKSRYIAKKQKELENKKAINKKLSKDNKSKDSKSKDSKNIQKTRRQIAKTHLEIRNMRDDFLHKLSRTIVGDNQAIIVEDLNVVSMINANAKIGKSRLNKDIYYCSWSRLIFMLTYKAEVSGKLLIKVNPCNTSKTCSNCGFIKHDLGSRREWQCEHCHSIHDRDKNAAVNIYKLGLEEPELKSRLEIKQCEFTSPCLVDRNPCL